MAKYLPWAFIALYGIFSVYVMLCYMQSSLLRERYNPTKYEGMISGEGHTPYVSRVLVPVMTRAVVGITPDFITEAVNRRDSVPGDTAADEEPAEDASAVQGGATIKAMPWLDRLFPKNRPVYPRLVTLFIVYGFLLGYVWAMHRLAEAVFPGNIAMRWGVPLVALAVLPSFTWPFQYMYDFSTLALSAACYYCIATGRLRAYLAFFILATLNKETSVFILLFFAVWNYGRLPGETYRRWLFAQALVYGCIKLVLSIAFMDNPGGITESHTLLVLNKDLFLNANSFRGIAIAGLCFLLTFRWQEKPYFAKISLGFIPLLAVLYVLYGNPGEYRICFDILPLLTLLLAHTLIVTTGIAQAAVFNASHARDLP